MSIFQSPNCIAKTLLYRQTLQKFTEKKIQSKTETNLFLLTLETKMCFTNGGRLSINRKIAILIQI